MSATATQRRIPVDVLTVLSAGRVDRNRFFLPASQLDRKLYEQTNDVLAALGGKWNRSVKAHVFAEPCGEVIEDAIESASFMRPGDMGWFPTPADIASYVAGLADIEPGMTMLEPSAGEGALVIEGLKAGALVYAVELDSTRAEKLKRLLSGSREHAVCVTDFLTLPLGPKFDRILMNPPFAKRADVHHVMHALKLLKPGGKLVAIMSASVAFRDDSLTREFRALCNSIEPLPDGAFKQSGTMVRTVVVEIST